MNSTIRTGPYPHAQRTASAVALGLALVVALALLVLVRQASGPVRLQLAAGAALLAVLALALARYDLAVAFGFALLGIVRVEPAPSDAILAIVVAVALVTGRFRMSRVPLVPVALAGAFIALSTLSLAAAVDLGSAVRFLIISLYMALLFVWLIDYVDSRRRARLLVLAYLVAALVSAVLGSLPFLLSFPGADLFTTEGGFRGQALFKDPNVFGPFLVPAILILVDEIVSPRLLLLRRSLKALLVLILLTGLLFSYSRAAWISLVLGVLMLFAIHLLRHARLQRMNLMITVLVAAVVVIGTLVALTGASSVIEERARLQTYDQQRFEAQREGVDLGLAHPLGVGPGQFDLHAVAGAHSLYVRVFAEQGPAGFLLLLLFMALTLAAAGENALRGRDTFGIGSGVLFATFGGLLVNSAVVDTLHWRHLWIVAALIWVGWNRRSTVGARG